MSDVDASERRTSGTPKLLSLDPEKKYACFDAILKALEIDPEALSVPECRFIADRLREASERFHEVAEAKQSAAVEKIRRDLAEALALHSSVQGAALSEQELVANSDRKLANMGNEVFTKALREALYNRVCADTGDSRYSGKVTIPADLLNESGRGPIIDKIVDWLNAAQSESVVTHRRQSNGDVVVTFTKKQS